MIDEFVAEAYDNFDESSILAGPQAVAETISPKRVRLEIARKQAIRILAFSDDGQLVGKKVGAAMQTSLPGSLMSAIDSALRESKNRRRSSVIAWADVIQKSRRFGFSRTGLVELSFRGEKSLLQQIIATKDFGAFIAIARPLPDGAYSNGNVIINDEYFGEAVGLTPNGLGALFYDSSFYVGDVRDGAMHGVGDQYFRRQLRYSGKFRHGYRHGHGVYDFSCGPRISAHFVGDLPEGEGCFRHLGNKETVFFVRRDKISSFLTSSGGRYDVHLLSDRELFLSKGRAQNG